MDNFKDLNYFCEFTDENGLKHWAIHSYNRITGIVTSMRDHRF